MKDLYAKLYRACKDLPDFEKQAHFVAIEGRGYSASQKKFMLVGRAPNGWGSFGTTGEAAFAGEAEKQFCDKTRCDWVEPVNGILRAREAPDCHLGTPYWSYARQVWEQLDGTVSDAEIWPNNIIWSNLYKVSKPDEGNPDNRYIRAQEQPCHEIFKKELDFFAPTHVLIMSGFDWFRAFSENCSEVKELGRNISRGKLKNNVFVEGTARYKNSKIVIACRPEARPKDEYVTAVLRAFKEME